ncbi:MAG: TRAP transporter small permease [Deltaproteobacteria bacterium]|nr:TRAP transporter small permease [Deltaproteobacteria bacterium]
MHKKILSGFLRLVDHFLVAGLAAMVILVFGNVVLRYGFRTGITVSEELSRYILVWITFIGGGAAMFTHQHLGVNSFVMRLPPIGKKICAVANILLMLLCFGYFFYGSWLQTKVNFDVGSTAMDMPMSYFYGAGMFFSALAIVAVCIDLYRILSGRATEDELVMVEESEDEVVQDEIAKQKKKL